MEKKIEPDPDPYPHPAAARVSSRATAWQLVQSYWHSSQRFPAYLFFSIIAVLTISLVGLDVIFNFFYYYFYDAIYAYDKHGMLRLLLVLFMIGSFSLVFEAYRFFVTRMCEPRWKNWIMEKIIARLFMHKRALLNQHTKEDVISVVNYAIDLSMGLIGMLTAFLGMLYVMYLMSDVTTISLGSWGAWKAPSILVLGGVVYALIGLIFIYKLKRPLVSPSFENSAYSKVLSKCFMGCYQLYFILPFLMVLPGSFEKLLAMSWLFQSLQTFNRMQTTFAVVVHQKSHLVGESNG